MKLSKVEVPSKSKIQPVVWEEPKKTSRKFIAILADGRRIAVIRSNWTECMKAVVKQNPVKVQYASLLNENDIMSFRCEGTVLHFEEIIKKGKKKSSKLQKI